MQLKISYHKKKVLATIKALEISIIWSNLSTDKIKWSTCARMSLNMETNPTYLLMYRFYLSSNYDPLICKACKRRNIMVFPSSKTESGVVHRGKIGKMKKCTNMGLYEFVFPVWKSWDIMDGYKYKELMESWKQKLEMLIMVIAPLKPPSVRGEKKSKI